MSLSSVFGLIIAVAAGDHFLDAEPFVDTAVKRSICYNKKGLGVLRENELFHPPRLLLLVTHCALHVVERRVVCIKTLARV